MKTSSISKSILEPIKSELHVDKRKSRLSAIKSASVKRTNTGDYVKMTTSSLSKPILEPINSELHERLNLEARAFSTDKSNSGSTPFVWRPSSSVDKRKSRLSAINTDDHAIMTTSSLSKPIPQPRNEDFNRRANSSVATSSLNISFRCSSVQNIKVTSNLTVENTIHVSFLLLIY